jgi:hypothetical protein
MGSGHAPNGIRGRLPGSDAAFGFAVPAAAEGHIAGRIAGRALIA